MKKKIKPIYLLLVLFTVASCNNENEKIPYADQLKDHNKIIEKYIERENIVVLDAFPIDSVFAPNEYVKTDSELYFQLVSKGDKKNAIAPKDKVIMRYYKHDLTEYPDTVFNLDTDDAPYPTEFQYGNYNDSKACIAWHEAVSYMKYSGSEARIIVPSKIGFYEDQDPTLIPTGYFIRIQFR